MTPREEVLRSTVNDALLNLMDRIDLCVYHMDELRVLKGIEDHVQTLLKCKHSVKEMLNSDFDRLAIAKLKEKRK